MANINAAKYSWLFDYNAELYNHSTKKLVLPATTLTDYCYQSMFNGCTSLTAAPDLPAEELAEHCYESMFAGCTLLEEAPKLPAKELANYCYRGMFEGCRALNAVTCLATDISASDATYNWLRDVAQTGTFTKAPGMTSWTVDTQLISDYSWAYWGVLSPSRFQEWRNKRCL